MDSVGGNIRKYRQIKKLRQEDLAELTNLSPNYIGMIERGEKTPSLETLIAIVNALGVSADMVLADALSRGYQIKASLLIEKLDSIPEKDRSRIIAVVETLLQYT